MTETLSRLLIVDDDPDIPAVVKRFAHKLGFQVTYHSSGPAALAALQDLKPDVALVDLQMPELSGIDVLKAMRAAEPDCQVILMTGNATVETAIEAVKAGALDYLPKPADADAVERALLAQEGGTPEPPEDPMSADRVRWEHIQRIFELCERNVSETARRLKMHRRTLQRILSKHAPRS